jgi:hypothetical protein
VVTRRVRWRRWTGYRSDLVRATNLAAAELETWHNSRASVAVAIDYKGELSERWNGVEEFEALSSDYLSDIDDLTIDVQPDREAWIARREESHVYEPYPRSEVRIRAWRTIGLEVVVTADRRVQVDGLAQQLRETLQGGAPFGSAVRVRDFALGLALPLCVAGAVLGDRIPEWIGYSTSDGSVDRWEALGIAVGVLAALALAGAIYFVFPTIEILRDGGIARHRRLRRGLVSLAGALVLTGVGIAIDRIV